MFILKKGKLEIEPKMLFIPEFKRLYSRDRTAGKAKSTKDFAYVYFMADYQSEYNVYGIGKQEMINLEVMNDKGFEPDGLILDAIQKYKKLQQTTSMRYLISVQKTIDSLIEYYDDLRFKKGDDKTKFNPANLTKAMKEVEEILTKVEKWTKKVKGEEEDMQIRGGGSVGVFEDPQSATWLKKKVS